MRITELEISNVRGICDLLLKPNGKNLVVWGPNGSGKSAVVDALDFLLTGQISRLMGKGTAGITLNKHGPHVGCTPEQAIVRAKVQIPGFPDDVEIKRCMAHPKDLICDKAAMPYLEPVLQLAERGEHVLTRREILRYITSEAGTRAEQIQALLNIGDVEEIRKVLVKVENELDSAVKSAKQAVRTAESAVNATLQQTEFQPDRVLEKINRNRAILGGQPISSLHSADLRNALVPPAASSGKPAVNLTLLETYLSNLREVVSEQSQAAVSESDLELRALIISVRSDPVAWRAVSRQQLTALGIQLIDETGSCPLCDTPWEPDELKSYLERRQAQEHVALQQHARITSLAKSIGDLAAATIASMNAVIAMAQTAELTSESVVLETWRADLQRLSESLSAALGNYPCGFFCEDRIKRLLAPEDTLACLNRLQVDIASKYPASTPEQTAHDTLTRLEENLRAVEKASVGLKAAELSYGRAHALRSSFEVARNTVLGKLYDEIRDRFVDLYKDLHRADEDKFTAVIEPDGAGLKFEVDFLGHGTHPPHALHSEGHQDSMGLCIFLALAERLASGIIDVVILDDVVMSVDADHRRELCRILTNHFPNRQFLITTHDRTWASQLRSEGVVDSRGSVEFYNWHLATGPQVSYEVDMWQRIEADLQKHDVPSAAARLRRGSEDFFRTVCDHLRASVTFKLSSQWELGDFLQAALSQYQALLKKAKVAANSWNDKDQVEVFAELSSTAASIFKRTQVEQWAVNANVHYNNWANFAPNDFQPVLEAFQDLYLLFKCSQCETLLGVTMIGPAFQSVKCSCGKVSWNLVEKGK